MLSRREFLQYLSVMGGLFSTSSFPTIASPKNITEAFNKFQDLNITALKDKSNPYFKSTYADLTSVIN